MPAKELEVEMANSKHIVCRSGYSSIMDLAALGKNAILVPTPGQTEQEYLAEKLKYEKKYYFEHQHEFNLMRAIEASKDYTGVKYKLDRSYLRNRIKALADRLNHSK